MSTRLRAAGFDVVGEESVPDDAGAIAAALRRGAARADAVLVSGGLGPTFDDLTREAASAAFGRSLIYRPALWRVIQRRYARYHKVVPEENKRQALALKGAEVLPNPNGSAPGQLLRVRGGRSVALLPGPATEFYPMFERLVLPRLVRAHARGLKPAAFSIRLSGVPESAADERLAPVRARWPRARFTILASQGEVSFHASQPERTAAAARRVRAGLARDIRAAVGEFAHAEGDETLEAALGRRLRARKMTLAVAESCTGGLIGSRLTAVAGSSDYFLGGTIAYANAVKVRALGVPRALLARRGAVSEECAAAMARGVRRATGASVGVAVTGIAGPGGGTKEKPVGLVFVAVSGPGARAAVRRLRIHGPREAVRSRAATAALRLAFDAAA
jgi:nicotinamide-nucleotide amidase